VARFVPNFCQMSEAKEFRMRISDHDHEKVTLSNHQKFDLQGVLEMSWLRGGEFTKKFTQPAASITDVTPKELVAKELTSLLDGLAQLSESERKRIIALSRVVSARQGRQTPLQRGR
jgi:predicted unusual protein kinase regulating ubiquinone biosynthesis (AarF/ABC1/UbiB family)